MTKPRRTIALVLGLAVASALVLGLTVAARDSGAVGSAKKALREMSNAKFRYGRAATPVELVAKADSIARITVDEIEGPMWNSRDGREWRGNETTGAQVISKVLARVDEVLYGMSVASPVQIVVNGDATVRYEGNAVPDWASISGGFVVEKTFIVLLRRGKFPMEGGNVDVWTLGQNFEGNWRIEAGRANGSDTKWSMPEAALRKFLADNWQSSRAAQAKQQ